MANMENSKLNEFEIRLNEEMEKDAEEIDVEKLKRLLDQIGEHSLTNDQKQELSLIYEELKDMLFNR
ncbi:MAG: hypothetical protein ACLRUN_04400 [Christensenellales bacterium]